MLRKKQFCPVGEQLESRSLLATSGPQFAFPVIPISHLTDRPIIILQQDVFAQPTQPTFRTTQSTAPKNAILAEQTPTNPAAAWRPILHGLVTFASWRSRPGQSVTNLSPPLTL
jgi:hypothetical protein